MSCISSNTLPTIYIFSDQLKAVFFIDYSIGPTGQVLVVNGTKFWRQEAGGNIVLLGFNF